MTENDWTTTSVKLERELKQTLLEFCKREQITPNRLIKQLIEKKLEFMLKPNVVRKDQGVPLLAKQVFEFDVVSDTFEWILDFGGGNRQVLSKNIPPDFLEKLRESIDEALQERERAKKELGDKSVIPKDILEYEVEG